jgi:hypothetical protein
MASNNKKITGIRKICKINDGLCEGSSRYIKVYSVPVANGQIIITTFSGGSVSTVFIPTTPQ